MGKSRIVHNVRIILPLKCTQNFHKKRWRCQRGQDFLFLTGTCLLSISSVSYNLPSAPREFQAKDPVRSQFLTCEGTSQSKRYLFPQNRIYNYSQNKPPTNPTSILGSLGKARGTKTRKSDLGIKVLGKRL